MPKQDLPCATCGRMMWRGTTSLPEGQARCRPCRRATPKPPKVYKRGPYTGVSHRTCEVCGQQYRAKMKTQRTCGRACGVQINAHYERISQARRNFPTTHLQWRPCRICDAWMSRPGLVMCSDECRREDARRQSAYAFVSQAKPTTRPCIDCGQDYTTKVARNAGLCAACRRARQKAKYGTTYRSRVRYFGGAYEPVDRLSVFARDDWTCQICGDPVLRGVEAPHPLSVSLDHIVPLARGGDHTYDNTQCAHLACNVAKGARHEESPA